MDPASTTSAYAATLAALVREALRTRYAHPVVVEQEGGAVAVLEGAALDLARSSVPDTLVDRVVALDVRELPWHAVPDAGLRLWRQHGREDEAGEVVTELLAGDPPVQKITEDAGWMLLRTYDGAQGWIRSRSLVSCAEHSEPMRDHVEAGMLVDAAIALEGVPYVWGGTTDAGVDCSGLVQRAAWRASRCWLPRHSRALLKVGRRVRPSDVRAGDVLVLKRDPRTIDAERAAQQAALAELERTRGAVPAHGPAVHPMHVAIAISSDTVLHASRDAMRVVREPLAALRERYRVLGVRRLTRANDPHRPTRATTA